MTGHVEVFELRAAHAHDAPLLEAMSTGPIAGKAAFIVESFERRTVLGAFNGNRVVGYVIWDHAFFGRPFVWLIGVDPSVRRRGLGMRLMRGFEAAWPGKPLFTSTNESNAPMHSLLGRIGYERSGRVENLDPGDPEIFYFKAAVQA